ncbi:MAG TPA: tRNA uridine-5-carboxymethylaminomethyl(34) synthesis GTPase MnmE [Chitinophagaceae bacterium]|jgi:tRNA modification GTPase|nr:tRNA uridine-5-carboxymethylaminomethyl(34) synthesis GTPase MnmE [Chitinophagaceae bacterium]
MIGKLTGWDDTIVALATPPGIGAIGIIRLSGKNSFTIIDQLFPSKDLAQQPSHSLHVGLLKDGDTVLDEVVVSIYKSPRSYTGEDLIEISGHGSPYVLQQIMEACIKKGARLAKPGEFTQRAFLNGKIDLTQAEAVADLIASNTSISHQTALHNIRGGFSQQLKQLRERLIRFSALIELELDFSQEDVEFADRRQLLDLIDEADHVTISLINSFKLGNVIKNGISVAIIGKPNAGKSTLLNALLNEERAIVSEIPGTTRDTIEETINIDGILFRLIDTAGIRQHTHDVIESVGVQRSLEKMREADLVLYLFDVNTMARDELVELEKDLSIQQIKHLLVGNKIDIANEKKVKEDFDENTNLLFVSAIAHQHLENLKQRMVDIVLEGQVQTESTIITNARHFHALQQLHASLNDVKKGLSNKLPGDLLALDIRRSLYYLGEITGEITNEDQLDYIFSKFCIGK